MISSFLFGENRSPEYHVFAGERLTYPFFVNIWSALWASGDPSLYALQKIFALQWMVIWGVFYLLIKGNRYPLLLSAVFLGGGSYLALGNNSGALIGNNVPWASFLATVWVTQRSALFGLLTIGTVLTVFKKYGAHGAWRAGIILALTPLVHTHFFLVTAAALGLYLILRLRLDGIQPLVRYCCSLIPALAALPWIVGKQGMLGVLHGWSTDAAKTWSASFTQWSSCTTATVWIVLWVAVGLWFRSYRALVIGALLFVIGNTVRLSLWEWDQIKYFIALYTIALFWLSWNKRGIWLQLMALLLVAPSGYELYRHLITKPRYEVYTAEAVIQAERIRTVIPPHGIVACDPLHNSPLTLTGRRMYLGYDGTLYSHGIAYHDRLQRFTSAGLEQCDNPVLHCPEYLLWTDNEVRKLARVPEHFKSTEVPEILRRSFQ
jgi:hypothetical protein